MEVQNKSTPLVRTVLFFSLGLVVGGLFTTGFFIAKQNKQAVTAQGVGEPLFKVDGNTFTSTTLPEGATMPFYQLESNIFNAKQGFSDQTALRLVLATQAGKPTSPLPELIELLPAQPVSDEAAKEYYDRIAAQVGPAGLGGQTFDTLKDEIKKQMSERQYGQQVNQKIAELKSTGRINNLLTAPVAPAVKLSLSGYPARGNTDSQVTLVEVADFMCPHCRETEPTMEKMVSEFGSKVKFVHVSFPLSASGLNASLARGAFCANKQGSDNYWKYHKQAFEVSFDKMKPNTANAAQTFDSDAIDVAKNAGLDTAAFTACLSSEEAKNYITKVQGDFNASNGFQGTPTFYLNDRLVQANPAQMEETLRTALNTYK